MLDRYILSFLRKDLKYLVFPEELYKMQAHVYV